jgi:hypothetical protein
MLSRIRIGKETTKATHNTDKKNMVGAYPEQWRRNGGMAEARPLLLLHLMMALGPALQQILFGVEPDTSSPSPTASSRLSHESQQGRVTGGRNSGRWARSLHLSNLKIIYKFKAVLHVFWASRIRIH